MERETWRENGLAPPMPGTDAEKHWAEVDKAVPYTKVCLQTAHSYCCGVPPQLSCAVSLIKVLNKSTLSRQVNAVYPSQGRTWMDASCSPFTYTRVFAVWSAGLACFRTFQYCVR